MNYFLLGVYLFGFLDHMVHASLYVKEQGGLDDDESVYIMVGAVFWPVGFAMTVRELFR